MIDRLLTTREAAAKLGVCTKTLLNRYRSTRGFPEPVSVLGTKTLRWWESAIDRYLESLKK